MVAKAAGCDCANLMLNMLKCTWRCRLRTIEVHSGVVRCVQYTDVDDGQCWTSKESPESGRYHSNQRPPPLRPLCLWLSSCINFGVPEISLINAEAFECCRCDGGGLLVKVIQVAVMILEGEQTSD